LSALEQGDPQAADRLLPLVYDELRQLAAQKLAHENPGQTLQPTALVHEAYLRLVEGADAAGQRGPSWGGRGHFFAPAAGAPRPTPVENARPQQPGKHGGGRPPPGPAARARGGRSRSRHRRPSTWPSRRIFWPSTGSFPGWPKRTRRRPRWSASTSSPACRSNRLRRSWASRAQPLTDNGPTPGRGFATPWPGGGPSSEAAISLRHLRTF